MVRLARLPTLPGAAGLQTGRAELYHIVVFPATKIAPTFVQSLHMKKMLRYGTVTVTHGVYLVLIALVIFWILMRAH